MESRVIQVLLRGDQGFWTNMWHWIVGSSVVANILALALERASAPNVLAAIVAVIIAPFVLWRQQVVSKFRTLRKTENELRYEVNRLHKENHNLSNISADLGTEVERLDAVEGSLRRLTVSRGTTVDKLVGLVKENGAMLEEIKTAVKASLMQTILTSLIDSDEDSSGCYSDREIQIMELRVKHLPGVVVNHALLVRKIRSSDRTLHTILQYAQHFGMDELPSEERIFTFDESMFLPYSHHNKV